MALRKNGKKGAQEDLLEFQAQDNEELYDEYDDYDEDEAARKSARKGCLIAFLVIFVIFAIVAGVVAYNLFSEIDGGNATATETVVMDVAASSSGRTIGGQLEEAGLIGSEEIFRFYERFLNSNDGVFQTGRFYIEPGMSYDEIIEVITQPPPPRDTKMVTFPEGITVMQFASIIEEEGFCTADEFLAVANDLESFSDIDVIARILEEGQSPDTFMAAEGYLAPNTYEFYVDESPENIARRLFEQFDAEMTSEVYARMEEQGLSVIETITLASLVEEEAGLPENQPPVAGVFWNRLQGDLEDTDFGRRTMGSDVTFFYIRDWIARDYGGNYEAVPDNLFYGYYSGDEDPQTREGLPVGPISCPSQTAIEAALYPEESDYYYFLTDFYGTYYYAQTFTQHENNIVTMDRMNAQFEAENADSAAQEETEG